MIPYKTFIFFMIIIIFNPSLFKIQNEEKIYIHFPFYGLDETSIGRVGHAVWSKSFYGEVHERSGKDLVFQWPITFFLHLIRRIFI